MELIERLEEFKEFPSGRQRLGLFLCPVCKQEVVRPMPNGKKVKSCGCNPARQEANSKWKGGVSKHPLSSVHSQIMRRCLNPKSSFYHRYGGRGIQICDEWREKTAFIAWAEANGWTPGLQIDRKNNDGPYNPENCRWVTHQINGQNSSHTQIDLETAQKIKRSLAEGLTVAHVACIYGVSYQIAYHIKTGHTWTNA